MTFPKLGTYKAVNIRSQVDEARVRIDAWCGLANALLARVLEGDVDAIRRSDRLDTYWFSR